LDGSCASGFILVAYPDKCPLAQLQSTGPSTFPVHIFTCAHRRPFGMSANRQCSGQVSPYGRHNFWISPNPKPVRRQFTSSTQLREKALLVRKCIVRQTTVLSTTRFPKAVGSGAPNAVRPDFHLKSKTSPNSSPNCMPKRLRIVLFAPPYSVEIISFPGFTIPLLTDRL
jgi:hypothetical protein